jgi:hypothetical protein
MAGVSVNKFIGARDPQPANTRHVNIVQAYRAQNAVFVLFNAGKIHDHR